MPKLFIVEEPSLGGMFTKAIDGHAPMFEGVGYIGTPIEGIKAEHVGSGTPAGYTHILLIGSPEFLNKQPIVDGFVYAAYALPAVPYIPLEQLSWVPKIAKIATPCTMTSMAIQMAIGDDRKISFITPWGYPRQATLVINKTEVRQLLVPTWDEKKPVILAPAEHHMAVCTAVSRGVHANLLFLGKEPEGFQTTLDLLSLDRGCVKFTESQIAWVAADLYLSLNAAVAWPWDAVYALSHSIPVALPKSHACETFIDGMMAALPISAFDVSMGSSPHYVPNSADIAAAIDGFVRDPQTAFVKAAAGAQILCDRTPAMFTRDVVASLFSE